MENTGSPQVLVEQWRAERDTHPELGTPTIAIFLYMAGIIAGIAAILMLHSGLYNNFDQAVLSGGATLLTVPFFFGLAYAITKLRQIEFRLRGR